MNGVHNNCIYHRLQNSFERASEITSKYLRIRRVNPYYQAQLCIRTGRETSYEERVAIMYSTIFAGDLFAVISPKLIARNLLQLLYRMDSID